MTIELPAPLQTFVDQQVQSGRYADAGEVVAAALLEWHDRDAEEGADADTQDDEAYQAYLRREIAIGIEQADRGLSEELDIPGVIRRLHAEHGIPPPEEHECLG